jgi:hypothetical protein
MIMLEEEFRISGLVPTKTKIIYYTSLPQYNDPYLIFIE